MYQNIGRKFKTFAKVYALVGAIISILEGIGIIIFGFVASRQMLFSFLDPSYQFFVIIAGIILGLLVALIGSLVSWIVSWSIYWNGEMVEKLTEIEKNTRIR